ncbi:MAG: hypothetical protein LBJ64_06685 [Deltaproteobacteria bacterium]|jgi:Tfp pilus assembly protein FimT|nr:hypothetical protein [Deltaproteobacteria bacterium]
MEQAIIKQNEQREMTGFSTIELVVVIAIIGVLLAIALPSYFTFVPRNELKTDVQTVRNVFKKARVGAATYQRPIRVLIDCTPATRGADNNGPCRLLAEMPLYKSNGSIKAWVRLPGAAAELHKATNVNYSPATTFAEKASYSHYQKLFDGFPGLDDPTPRTYGVPGKPGFANDSFVIVFTPSGEAVSFCSLSMRFTNKFLQEKNVWLLNLVNATGHVRLMQETA